MRIKKEFIEDTTELLKLGFGYEDTDEYEDYELKNLLSYNMGHSRRGQCYYLIVQDDGELTVYASRPDGSGTDIPMDDIILDMYELGMFENR